jgi:hypothetical protein
VKADVDDIVTCERGHPLYRITRPLDLSMGPPLVSAAFERISPRAEEPVRLTRIKGRCSCGAQWLSAAGLDLYARGIHFEEGWRK